MNLYKKLYFMLFGKIEDALALMDDGNMWEAKETLLNAVEEAENTYLNADEEPTEEVLLSEMMSQFLKTLHRLGKEDQQAALRLTKHWSGKSKDAEPCDLGIPTPTQARCRNEAERKTTADGAQAENEGRAIR